MKIALALVSITFRLSIALIVQVQNHETVSRSAQALPDPSPTKESQSTAITRRTHVSFSCDRRVITRIHMGAEIDNALYLLRDFCSAASQATQRASLTTTTTTSASADNNFYLDTLEHHFGRGLNWDIVNIIHKRYEKIVHELNAAPRGKVLVRCDDPQQRCAERFFNTPVDIYFHTEMRYINVVRLPLLLSSPLIPLHPILASLPPFVLRNRPTQRSTGYHLI